MTKAEVMKALPKQCHLAAKMEVGDHMLRSGMPLNYITRELAHTLGKHLGEKSSTFVKRESNDYFRDPYAFRAPGYTIYTAEVFVFSEEELLKFAQDMRKLGTAMQLDSMVQIETTLKVAAVKSELKKKLKATIDKAID